MNSLNAFVEAYRNVVIKEFKGKSIEDRKALLE
jgi:hypothetical protein